MNYTLLILVKIEAGNEDEARKAAVDLIDTCQDATHNGEFWIHDIINEENQSLYR